MREYDRKKNIQIIIDFDLQNKNPTVVGFFYPHEKNPVGFLFSKN